MVVGLRESRIISQWGVLELSSVSFIPLLVSSGNSVKRLAGVKYFLSQAPASVWILISLTAFNSSFFYLMLTPALLFKLALPPFHGWLFSLINNIGLKELAVLLTIQKFIPLHMLEIFLDITLLIISLIRALLILLVASLSVSSFKPVLIISSISGSYWPIFSIYSGNIWLEYIIIYSFFFLIFCYYLNKENVVLYIRVFKKRLLVRLLIALQLFNLGGIPPLAGFFIKLIVVKGVCLQNLRLLMGLLRVSFLILYFYLQLVSSLVLFTSNISSQKLKRRLWPIIIFFGASPVLPLMFIL